jgi:hypothetical protein
MPDPLSERLERVYAAIGQTIDADLSRLILSTRVTDRGLWMELAVRDATAADLDLAVWTLIHTIATLSDKARIVCGREGIDPKEVEAISADRAVAILRDLDNADKHGEPRPGQKTHSGLHPRLGPITPGIRSRAPGSGKELVISFGPEGTTVSGPGRAEMVLRARVFDETGQRIGDLQDLVVQAVTAWEEGLERLGFGPFPPR